jgi:hypothetical protein
MSLFVHILVYAHCFCSLLCYQIQIACLCDAKRIVARTVSVARVANDTQAHLLTQAYVCVAFTNLRLALVLLRG